MKKILSLAMIFLIAFSMFSMFAPQVKAEGSLNSNEAPDDYTPVVTEERLGNSEVLVIEDIIPWYRGYWPCDADAVPAALDTLGKTYDLIHSDKLATTDLTAYKIIILASTQGRSTYVSIDANIEKINAFVTGGGVYICHACDYGWGYPYEWSDWSGLQIMPGGVTHVTQYPSMYIHIVNPASPIVTGLDDAYFAGWGYATHGYFTSVPPDADVVMVTETYLGSRVPDPNKPTYIVYSYGSGKVLATMQTIEWGWGGVYYWVGGFRKEFLLNEISYAQTLVVPVAPKILPVPYYYQGATNWCLPTSMSMIFKYYGQNIHSWDIAKDWGWRRDVAWWEFWETWDMMAWNVKGYFEAHGLAAEYTWHDPLSPINFETIKAWIDTKGPVLFSLIWPINHAVVVVGYTAAETVYVNDPSGTLLEEIFPLGELPDQPYTAIELSWSDIPIPWLSWAMVVEGTPSPPSGTIDIHDYGVRFWHRNRQWPPGVYSWLYGLDKGLIWEHSDDHPLALNSRDQFQFFQYIVNHMEDSQTYVLEIDFASERAPLTPVSGKGMWIWHLSWIENGDVSKIIGKVKSAGIKWVAIKTADGENFWTGKDELTSLLVGKFHSAGIRVFGCHYVYGNNAIEEAAVSNKILDIEGIDGLIIDAETEYEGKQDAAKEYLNSIRQNHPESFIAYTTFGNPRAHTSFPYLEFGKYCDVAMPQVYWIDWGITPADAVNRMNEQWNELYSKWERNGKGDSIKPIIPMGQSSDETGTIPAKKGEITEFCNAVHESGYEGVIIFRYGTMQEEHWGEYAKCLLPLCLTVSVEGRHYKSNIMDPVSLRDLLKYPGKYTVTLRLWNEDCTEEYDEVVFPSIKYSLLIEFYLASVANLYVTDPRGLHVGVDPSTGQVVNEIPGAIYTGQGSEPQVVAIPDPLDGNYVVLLIGTATGTYSVTTELILAEETITQTYTGDIIEGKFLEYLATVSETDVATTSPVPAIVVDKAFKPNEVSLRRKGSVMSWTYINNTGYLSLSEITFNDTILDGWTTKDLDRTISVTLFIDGAKYQIPYDELDYVAIEDGRYIVYINFTAGVGLYQFNATSGMEEYRMTIYAFEPGWVLEIKYPMFPPTNLLTGDYEATVSVTVVSPEGITVTVDDTATLRVK
jgi:hypothetical protein